MPYYQRMAPVLAVQFHEKDYAEHPSKYPEVFDMAMTSGSWRDKSVEDGRYYIVLQSVIGADYITVNENDYIVRDPNGITYTIPDFVFEKNYELIKK